MTQRSQTQNFRLFIEQIFRLQEKNRRIPKTVGIERAFLPHHICYMRAVFALRSSSLCGPLRLCDLCAGAMISDGPINMAACKTIELKSTKPEQAAGHLC